MPCLEVAADSGRLFARWRRVGKGFGIWYRIAGQNANGLKAPAHCSGLWLPANGLLARTYCFERAMSLAPEQAGSPDPQAGSRDPGMERSLPVM